jgi:branched-chain amino acid aminotransferase
MQYPIRIEKVAQSRVSQQPLTNLVFGKLFTDHLFIADFADGKWGNCHIAPYGPIATSPSLYTMHYGQGIFEGMKAVLNAEGTPMMFRPLDNLQRLNYGARRMALPEVPEEIFMNGLTQLLQLDKAWIPTEAGSALYIRPFLFATDSLIGIKPTEKFRFMIIATPVSKYYDKPVKILVADEYVRAFKGGTGDVKAIGNYGATMLPMIEARQKGYDQVLWMDGAEFKYAHEIGTMNFFVQIGDTFVTPNIDGCILEGITRKSVIALLKDGGYTVEERPITIDEIVDAADKGILNDAFGTGTAASLSHIELFGYQGRDLMVKPVVERTISTAIKNRLDNIKCGNEADKFNWVVPC